MATQTTAQRAVTAGHARELLHHLEACSRASVEDLGRARDLVNTVCNVTDPAAVKAASAQLEDLLSPSPTPATDVPTRSRPTR